MNQKRTFGTILTILGIIGLIYAGVNFANGDNGTRVLIVYFVLGLIFFFTGIGLIRNTRDAER
ncbi:MAG TPA: hypothetical protein VGE15_12550 [Sphingobacteriaceae bacterium]